MHKLMFGSFDNHDDVNQALDELQRFGVDSSDISVITTQKDVVRRKEMRDEGRVGGVASSIAEGAGTGAILGGLAGLLAASVGIIVVGPIAALLGLAGLAGTTITGLVIGAAAGGLIGALTRLGLPEETARGYEETVKAGGVVLAVPFNESTRDEVRDIMLDAGARDLAEIETNDKKY